jgi:ABC-2 type transport system permease protein
MTAPAATLSRPGLGRLSAVELRKSADTRAGFWLLVVLVLLAIAVVVLQAVFAEDDIDRTFTSLLSSAIQVVSIILPVLGILLVTSEWSQRTGLSTFALVPQRERIVFAKVFGATVLTVFAVVACVLVAAVGNLFAGGDWELGLGYLGRLGLFELIGMLGGVAFGLAFMNSALAIVMYFVIPIGWSILGETIAALDKPADWLDLSRPISILADSTATMTGTNWAQLGTATAVWVGLVFVIGLIRLRRTELK